MPEDVNRLDQAREQLIAEREATLAEMQALQERVERVDVALASLDGLTGRGSRATGARPRRRDVTSRPATRRGAITEAVDAYLDGQGRKAVHGDQILEHLVSVGTAPSGKNPKASLQTILRNLAEQGRTKNIGRNRWRKLRGG